jgi:hypothetical protein
MTSTRTRKPAPKKRRTARKKKSTSRFYSVAGISRIILLLVLVLFLFISIGTTCYVIFFRVVVAADLDRTSPASIAAFVIDRAGSMSNRRGVVNPKIEHGERT